MLAVFKLFPTSGFAKPFHTGNLHLIPASHAFKGPGSPTHGIMGTPHPPLAKFWALIWPVSGRVTQKNPLWFRPHVCMYAQSCLTTLPGHVARQTPLSMEFFRQEYWSGLPFPSPGDLRTQGSNPSLLHCQEDSLPLSHLVQATSILNHYLHAPNSQTHNLVNICSVAGTVYKCLTCTNAFKFR